MSGEVQAFVLFVDADPEPDRSPKQLDHEERADRGPQRYRADPQNLGAELGAGGYLMAETAAAERRQRERGDQQRPENPANPVHREDIE